MGGRRQDMAGDPSQPEHSTKRPLLLAVDDDPDARRRIRGELDRRYGSDYRVICADSASRALARLEQVRDEGGEVALVLAEQWMSETTGAELLAKVRRLHPTARRGLLIEWGGWADEPTREALLRTMALGHMDYYVLKPWSTRDESFHHTIAELLYDWSRSHPSRLARMSLVGPRLSVRTHELRSLLSRNSVPFEFCPVEEEHGQYLLAEAGVEAEDRPVVILGDGSSIVDPSNADLGAAYGITTELQEDDYDLVVVGAGPGGLAAGVYGSSEGLRTLVIESEAIGGQAGSSSLIRNYLGFARGIGGSELATRAYQQAWLFGTSFLLMHQATGLRPERGRHVVTVSNGDEVTASAVVLATGVSYSRLGIESLEALNGMGVFYGASVSEAQGLGGEVAYVVGGGNSAGQAAMHLSRYAARVVMVVRGGALDQSMSSYLCREIDAAPNIEIRADTEIVDGGGDGSLEWLALLDRTTGSIAKVDTKALFLLIGARPRTEWLPPELARDPRGYVLTGSRAVTRSEWPAAPAPTRLETSLPGVFAVGDVRFDAVKRVASAVGEGSVVIAEVHEHLAAAGVGRAGAAAGR
ncbi:MAG: FAD-dependent oxidoreductase [Thermoleophilaceae bacterium]